MTTTTVIKAAQGADTQDLLNHIAWTDVILPKIDEARESLTKQLVNLVLTAPGSRPGGETQEQIAGKLYGLNYLVTALQRILAEGNHAKELMSQENIFLQ